jgi:hypothetical protein
MFKRVVIGLLMLAVVGLAELMLPGCEESPQIQRTRSVNVSTMPVGTHSTPMPD